METNKCEDGRCQINTDDYLCVVCGCRYVAPTERVSRVEQIRRAHVSARPKATVNPAWFHAENDIGYLLDQLDELVRLLTYAVKYSSAKGIFPDGFLEDADVALAAAKVSP